MNAEIPNAPRGTDAAGPATISVVVPVYNEEELVGDLVQAVHEALKGERWRWELIVVDDGSRDATWRELLAARDRIGPHVRPIRLSRNFRQTAALQAGIDAARGEVIVTMDGDLQNDPRDIASMVERLEREDLDLVAGWRRERQDNPLMRNFPSRMANRLIRSLSGLPFHDLGCSLKVYRGSVLRQVRLYGEMHRFIPVWLATVTSPDRFAEQAVHHHPRTRGESKYGIGRVPRVLIDLLSMQFFTRFMGRPGHFFGGLGLGIGSIGLLLLGWLGLLKLSGEDIGGRPLLLLAFFAVLGGLQLLMTGVLAEVLMRTYYGQGGHRSYVTREATTAQAQEAWHEPTP